MNDFTILCLCAFRYAIERKTGISYEISNILKRFSDEIEPWAKAQIKRDIEWGIEKGRIDKIDMPNWISLLDAL